MTYGLVIDNDYLRQFPEYKDKTDAQITAADRSKVALKEMNAYQGEATKRCDDLVAEHSGQDQNTATVGCRIYNASGDRITVNFTHSWLGYFFKESPDEYVENGQWSAFVVVADPVGTAIYRTNSQTDIFVGWRHYSHTLGSDDISCYVESRGKNHWWEQGSKGNMKDRLERSGRSSKDDSSGYKVVGSIGGSNPNSYSVIIEKS
ncbi:hypothetical protein Hypma_013679 [Hypsizygus marmoreus]|uniref:Uncharacterized protein n=1 Tax=Hypsizygus marmoreus TaxID=39966 RepID=A0A369JDR2_HYPMA|nr:hypothetical protein Hypma_013679 [Hypsizygus marmoreus]